MTVNEETFGTAPREKRLIAAYVTGSFDPTIKMVIEGVISWMRITARSVPRGISGSVIFSRERQKKSSGDQPEN